VEQVNRLVNNNRTLAVLKRQADDALKQLLFRAHCGDDQALAQYAQITRAAARSLGLLAEHHGDRVRAEAARLPDWPLNLSQHESEWAKRELRRLGVGAKLPLLLRPSARGVCRSHWGRLAWHALLACGENKRVVPALKALTAGAKAEREMLRYSRQSKAWATFYYLGNGDVVIIPDWQDECTNLPGRFTKASAAAWWNVVKNCVLQHWLNPAGNYIETLALIPGADRAQVPFGKPPSDEYYKQNKDYRKRSAALARVKQAFEGIVRCST
jgi:hypothetical protein